MRFPYCFIALMFILTSGCNKGSQLSELVTDFDCTFVEDKGTTDGLLDDIERSIIKECREHKIISQNAIKSNLIGEWILIGFGDGWRANVTQPCGYIKITKDELIFDFENEYIDTVSRHLWQIENSLLKVTPANRHLSMQMFCDQFMYGNYSDFGVFALDVDQYIYEKVK